MIIGVWSLGFNLTRIATKMTISLSSEPQARSLTNREITQEWNNARPWAKGRTNSAINNSQTSGYVRAPEDYSVHRGSGAPVLRHSGSTSKARQGK